jgi:ATP-dependent Lon protease
MSAEPTAPPDQDPATPVVSSEVTTESPPPHLFLPLLPLRELVPFPGLILPVQVGRTSTVAGIAAAEAGDHRIVLVAQRNAEQEELIGLDDLHQTGVVGKIIRAGAVNEPPIGVIIQCQFRARIKSLVKTDAHWTVEIEPLPEVPVTAPPNEVEGLVRAVRENLSEYFSLNANSPVGGFMGAPGMDTPGPLADLLAQIPDIPFGVRQAMLDADDVLTRLRVAQVELIHLIEVQRISGRIQTQVRAEMDKTQRTYILREQLAAIQRELGESDPAQNDIAVLRARAAEKVMPDDVRARAVREIDRLSSIPAISPEVAIIRTYVDWLLDLPWSELSSDDLDLIKAAQILDEDHYGLAKPKERILEFLAVHKLAPTVKSPILCLAGPPGVGKTSLGRSVARAMDRKFVRLSLGGMNDEAEIRGHRRTYIGALPGRILQQLKVAGTANPVFMLDEIDKLGSSWRGDPAAALLEVLDPEQNYAFMDNYIEVPFDLSRVLFVATANIIDGVLPALRDRMEVISLPGYTGAEKLAIAQRHLLPKQHLNNGLATDRPTISDGAVSRIISGYTHEAGVRNLERELGTVLRKVARTVAEGQEAPARIEVDDLDRYLGAPRFEEGELAAADAIGEVTGLVVTEAGGDVVSVEASAMNTPGGLILTGQLGEVMRESARAALSWVETHGQAFGVPETALRRRSIHIHVPAGAVPKDGPSAGVTMVVALVSALANRPVRRDVAMTGEITLRGQVLPVGGIKAKVLAAHRAGASMVLIPRKNEKDLLEEVPQEIRTALDIRLIDNVEEVLRIVLRPAEPSSPPMADDERPTVPAALLPPSVEPGSIAPLLA